VPIKAWVKNALDHVIQECMNEPGLEFVWVGDDAIDPLEQAQTLNILVSAGIKTREEAPADLGLGPTAGAAAQSLTDAVASAGAPTPCERRPQRLRARTKREHFLDRLRGLPSRADIHDLELRLGERMDSLAARFDRAFDPHFS
jgi:hypothetical protein